MPEGVQLQPVPSSSACTTDGPEYFDFFLIPEPSATIAAVGASSQSERPFPPSLGTAATLLPDLWVTAPVDLASEYNYDRNNFYSRRRADVASHARRPEDIASRVAVIRQIQQGGFYAHIDAYWPQLTTYDASLGGCVSIDAPSAFTFYRVAGAYSSDGMVTRTEPNSKHSLYHDGTLIHHRNTSRNALNPEYFEENVSYLIFPGDYIARLVFDKPDGHALTVTVPVTIPRPEDVNGRIAVQTTAPHEDAPTDDDAPAPPASVGDIDQLELQQVQ
jgi:hypothetical protein